MQISKQLSKQLRPRGQPAVAKLFALFAVAKLFAPTENCLMTRQSAQMASARLTCGGKGASYPEARPF
jgi:hypothetical protein